MEECCGRCKHHKAVRTNSGDNVVDWFCDNEDAEYYTEYTDYACSCEDFEER